MRVEAANAESDGWALGVGDGDGGADGGADGARVGVGPGEGVALTMAVSGSTGTVAGKGAPVSAKHVTTGSVSTEPLTVSGPAFTQPSVRPGSGRWIRSHESSARRPVTRSCWPPAIVSSAGPWFGHG